MINSVLVIQKCWRRHQRHLESRRRVNAAVKIQSGKLIKLLRFSPAMLHVLARYCRHSVFLPKQESSEFVLKTIPLFSTNDLLLGSSVVISLKIFGRFNENNAMLSNGTEDDLWLFHSSSRFVDVPTVVPVVVLFLLNLPLLVVFILSYPQSHSA